MKTAGLTLGSSLRGISMQSYSLTYLDFVNFILGRVSKFRLLDIKAFVTKLADYVRSQVLFVTVGALGVGSLRHGIGMWRICGGVR